MVNTTNYEEEIIIIIIARDILTQLPPPSLTLLKICN